jgi:hypothetical protein
MALHTADDRTKAALLTAGAVVVAGALTLAGCMQQRAPAPPGQTAQIRPGMGFGLDRNEDEGWKLSYGQANTDNLLLMLECKPGSRKIDVFDLDRPKTRNGAILTLSSGKVQSALPVSVEADDGSEDGALVVAHATPDLPALDRFRHSGAIRVKLGSREFALSANASEKAQIAKFFNGCERR